MRLLLLEDDKHLAEGIIKGLGRMGYLVELAANLSEAESALRTDKFDLAIFDLGLPDGNAVPLIELRELEARIRVQVRKANQHLNDIITCGQLNIDLSSQECRFRDKMINLTRLEWLLLKQLALHKGKIVSKEQLASACYGWGGEHESNSLEVHIHHLRKKIDGNLISTIRGLGYRLQDESS